MGKTRKSIALKETVSLAEMAFVLFGFRITAQMASGNWTSGAYTDWDGVSQVGTTRSSNGAATVTLTVHYGDGTDVGTKTVGVTKGKTVEHTYWGVPFQAGYGTVSISGTHSPWFHASWFIK